jgi:galactokinase
MGENNEAGGALQGKGLRKAFARVYGDKGIGAQIERHARLAELARSLLGEPPAGSKRPSSPDCRFFSAPGRTELGGNHTDHNHGRVLCAAVALDVAACVIPAEGSRAVLRSEGYPGEIVVDFTELQARPSERGKPEALLRGVARGISDRGLPLRGFVAALHSNIPPGSGLSSSAAVEVLFGTILTELAGGSLPPIEIARIGQAAENEYFGKPCGLMDQSASAFGGIVSLDFKDPAAPKVKRVDFDFGETGYRLVVVDTGGSHADLTADYAAIPIEMCSVAALLGGKVLRDIDPVSLIARGPEIRAACGDRAFLRALHFSGENARVQDMAASLKNGDMNAYLKQVKRSGDSSWRLLQNLYPPSSPAEQGPCAALALSAEFLRSKGAYRVHGGGFAGTVQAYVPNKLMGGYTELMERYFGAGSVIPAEIRIPGATRVF